MAPAAPRWSAGLGALFGTLLWATAWVRIKFGLEAISPLAFAGLRYGPASLLLLPAIFVSGAGASLRTRGR